MVCRGTTLILSIFTWRNCGHNTNSMLACRIWEFQEKMQTERSFPFTTLLYLFNTGICGRTCTPQVQRLHSKQHIHFCIHWYHGYLKPWCLRRLAHGVCTSCSAIRNYYNLIIFPPRVTNLVRETKSNDGSWESVAVAMGAEQWRTGKCLFLYGRGNELQVILNGSDDHALRTSRYLLFLGRDHELQVSLSLGTALWRICKWYCSTDGVMNFKCHWSCKCRNKQK